MPIDVSVVVPVFNGKEFIEGCTRSIATAVHQLPIVDRRRIEILICENWSTDGTADLVDVSIFGCEARLIRPERHLENRTANWQHAVRSSSGAWVQMLHADDLMAKYALVGRLRAIAQSGASTAVMIAARHRTFKSNETPSALHPRWSQPALLNGPTIARRVLPFHCPFVPFTLFRRSAFFDIGGFDMGWELIQDWDLWTRLLVAGDLLYDPHEAGHWRLHPLSAGYRHRFAMEHEAYISTLACRVPGLRASALERARRVHQARASVIRMPGISRIRDVRTVKWNARLTGVRMQSMRVLGSVRSRRVATAVR